MDNEEILTGMGFKYITGDLWHHLNLGYINITIEDNLESIAIKIFSNGIKNNQESIKNILGI